MKFTFKTERATGNYRAFFNDEHLIKLNHKEVGNISDGFPCYIRLMVFKTDINEDGNPNCPWKWIRLKKKSVSLTEAKAFLNENIEAILAKYKLHGIA